MLLGEVTENVPRPRLDAPRFTPLMLPTYVAELLASALGSSKLTVPMVLVPLDRLIWPLRRSVEVAGAGRDRGGGRRRFSP